MKHHPRPLSLIWALALVAAAPSWGQPEATAARPPAAPAREVPRPDQLEPGVDTSATPPSSTASESTSASQAVQGQAVPGSKANATPPTPRAKPSSQASTSAGHGAPVQGSPDANTAGAGTPANAAAAQPKPGAGKAQDRLELDTTQITGNRELPKVLYIVPWKRSDLGDLVGKPANSLLDEVLAPVDRDVFKRENRYYNALKPDAARPEAGTAAAPASEAGAAPQGTGKP